MVNNVIHTQINLRVNLSKPLVVVTRPVGEQDIIMMRLANNHVVNFDHNDERMINNHVIFFIIMMRRMAIHMMKIAIIIREAVKNYSYDEEEGK